jgi:formiminotetrahydrofolate cyclodeaminase
LQAASLNVFINTKLMADRERAAALDAKTDKLLDEFVSRADAVFASVTNKLRNK